jgi:hypothetical protein
MTPSRTVRRVLSGICWTLAVVAGILTGAAFAGGGQTCQAGQRTHCPPQTWLLVLGIVVTLGFGVAGAVLYKPSDKPQSRFPWEDAR